MTTTQHIPATHERSAIGAMYAGLALTVTATVVAYVDHATGNALAGHIRSGYPSYTSARVESAASTYLAYLTVVGALGVVGWLAAIWAVTAGKKWARAAGSLLFGLGTGIALFDLLVKDTSGDTGLPPFLGWAGLLPCLPGLLAVVLLWRRS